MEESQTAQYLANVLSVARADGTLSPAEDSALEGIRSSLKAKKTHLNQAQKVAASDDFVPTPVGRYSEQIRNIEDMVYVALIDGELANEEKRVVTAFAKQTGCTQDQLNRIVSEAKARVLTADKRITCSSCKKQVSATAKFCSECGALLGQQKESAGTKIEFSYPLQGISIEFSESSSASFHVALQSAKQAPDFQECERDKKKWFLATWQRGQIANATDLVVGLKGLRNRMVHVDGERKDWDEVFGFVPCFCQRQQAYRPVQYCFGVDDKRLNVWGCRQAKMDWTEWAGWFSYGRFRKKDVFVFDKRRIRHELSTNLFTVRFCPCLRSQLVKKLLDLLPDEVRVSEQAGWRYSETYQQGPQSIRISQTQRQDGFSFSREFFADGVRPVGYTVARGMLEAALKECGIADVSARDLTG